MELLTGILIGVGVVLGFLLIVFVYAVRKYLLVRTTRFTLLTEEKETEDFKKFKGGSESGFEVPYYTRPVRRQVPNFGLREGPLNEKRKKSSVTVLDTQSFHSGHTIGGRRKKNSRVSHSSIGDKENQLVESTLPADIHGDHDVFAEAAPKFDKTQRRISTAVINVLALQGKQAPPSSRVSITEDMFIRDLEINNDTFLNVDRNSNDGSSVHSLPDVVDCPSVGTGVKRRVVDRRQRGSDNTPLKRTYKKSGKIKFTTRYFHEDNMLELHIHKAYDLKLRKEQINPTCFVRVYLVPGKRQRKETQSARGLEPFFNEKIQFVDLEERNLIKYRIKMKVYNKERLKKKELLGEVGIALNSIDINLKETFTPDLFLQRSESSLASVSILLCHQATYNKLEVTVQKACNLPRIGMGGQPSTYATVQLFKEDSVDKKDIVVKRNSRDPVFKEMVEFDVNIDANCPLSRYSLVISLIHKAGIVGRDEILGHVIFSISSPQKSAAEHWKFICDTPHQHLEQSHSLVDPDELLNSNESSST